MYSIVLFNTTDINSATVNEDTKGMIIGAAVGGCIVLIIIVVLVVAVVILARR
jgi:Ca2+/Na+ antiporter